MSNKILDNGTILTLGLVGAVAAIGAAAQRGVYGSRAKHMGTVGGGMEFVHGQPGRPPMLRMRSDMSLAARLNDHGFAFEEVERGLLVDDAHDILIRIEGGMADIEKRKMDANGNLTGMKSLGEFPVHSVANMVAAMRGGSRATSAMKGSRSRGSRAMVSEGIYKDISLPAAELGEAYGRDMLKVDVNTQDEDWTTPWLVTVGSGYSGHHFVVFGNSEDSALAHAIETAVITARGLTARRGNKQLEESLREYDGEGYVTDDGMVYLGHFDSLHIRRLGNDVRPLLQRHGVSLEGEGSGNRGSRSRSRGSRATAIPKFIGEAGEAGNYYYWAIKVAGVDPRFPMKSFGRQLEDYEKLKEWKKSAKQDYISTKSRKGQKPKTELRRWLESVKPSEFYVKWDLGVDDDTRLIYYKD